MALLPENERFGALVVVGALPSDPDGEPRYRVRCLKCDSDSVTAREDALFAGGVTQCFDCNQLSQLTDAQRALAAFRKTLDLSPEQEELDRVDLFAETSAPLTIAEAIAA